MIKLTLPCDIKDIQSLKTGDSVLLSGTIYTARDVAHKRLVALLKNNKKLPFDIRGAAIYYCGPCPATGGRPIGPCGPTTSSRMDEYSPYLLDYGLKIMIGKGYRSKEVIDCIIKNQALYLAAIGGAAALYMDCVKKSEVVCFEDLGTEAIRRLEVVDFPLIVAVSSDGKSIYDR